MMLQQRIQNLSNLENSHSQDDEVMEQEEEEKFDFDSNILETSDGAMVFIPDAKRDLWVTAENTLFMETFTLKGSSFQEHFQHGLKMCNKVLIQNGTDNKAHSRANKSAPNPKIYFSLK